MKDDLPKEAGELFAVPPNEFTKRAQRSRQELKKAGNLEASKKVASLAKPSLSVC